MLPPRAQAKRALYLTKQSAFVGRDVDLYPIPRTQSGGKSGFHDPLNKKVLTGFPPIFTSSSALTFPFLDGEGEWVLVVGGQPAHSVPPNQLCLLWVLFLFLAELLVGWGVKAKE